MAEIQTAKYRHLRFDRDGAVLTVTMDNPPLNAAGFELHDELSYVFQELVADPCRIVVLTGAGRAFSAGGDLNEMLANCAQPERQSDMMSRAPYIAHGILNFPRPIIARVNGHAMGLGATLALLCDVAIIVDTAKIADPHVNVGLSTGDGGAILWPLLVGFARARHHLLTGEALTGAQAAELGLVYKAVAAADLDAAVHDYVQRLLTVSPTALSATKQSINLVLKAMTPGLIEAHIGLEHVCMGSADHREALTALIEKRPSPFG